MLSLSRNRFFANNCPKKTKKESSKTSQAGNGAACYAEEELYKSHDEEEALPLSSRNLIEKSEWIIDSGATQLMTIERKKLEEDVEFNQPSVV